MDTTLADGTPTDPATPSARTPEARAEAVAKELASLKERAKGLAAEAKTAVAALPRVAKVSLATGLVIGFLLGRFLR